MAVSKPPPMVSVAIRAYRERWLREAIDSVLDGACEDVELIIYDDRGGLEEIAMERADPRVRYHRATEKRDEAGRFVAAVALCHGTYIGVLDDDDRYEPGFLSELTTALQRNPAAGVAFCKARYETGGGGRAPTDGRRGGVRPEVLREVLAFRTFIPPSLMVFRREMWDDAQRHRPMPGGIAPDAYLHFQAGALGWEHVLVDDCLAVRRWHPGQTSQSGLPMARMTVLTWEAFQTEDRALDAIRLQVLARKRIRLAVHLLAADEIDACRTQLELARATRAPRWRLVRAAVAVAASVPAVGRPLAGGTLALLTAAACRTPPPLTRPA